MPAEDVKKFLASVEKDAALRKKVTKESQGAVDRVMKIAKQKGFKFTKADLHDHLKKKWGAKKLPSSGKVDPFTCVVF